MNARARSVLQVLVIASIASTAIHYADNAISIDKYPRSDLATANVVVFAWLLLTPAAMFGYRLYASGRLLLAYPILAAYSLLGLSTPWHYTEASLRDFALWRNISILSDGVTGGAILTFALWSALIAREWLQPVPAHASPSVGRTRA